MQQITGGRPRGCTNLYHVKIAIYIYMVDFCTAPLRGGSWLSALHLFHRLKNYIKNYRNKRATITIEKRTVEKTPGLKSGPLGKGGAKG